MAAKLFLMALLALTSSIVIASDPSPLQDFCVADEASTVFMNGLVCKDPKLAKAEDFFFSGLDKPGNTSNRLGSTNTWVSAAELPGLNTLGISMTRLDFAPYGLLAPHFHPRASKIAVVLEGSLYVGFVTSDPDNKLFAKVLNKGDVFVFPKGLIHFMYNFGDKNTVAISAFDSQNPGVVTVANAVFGTNPSISDDALAKAFMLDKKTVDWLQARF